MAPRASTSRVSTPCSGEREWEVWVSGDVLDIIESAIHYR
jgi:hypothetical protein